MPRSIELAVFTTNQEIKPVNDVSVLTEHIFDIVLTILSLLTGLLTEVGIQIMT